MTDFPPLLEYIEVHRAAEATRSAENAELEPDHAGREVEGAKTLSFIGEAVHFHERTRDYRNLLRPIQRMLTPHDGTKKPAVCMCGYARGSEVSVHLIAKSGKNKAVVSGVYRCGNGEACSFCAPRVAAVRAGRYRKVHEAVTARNGRMLTITLTISHDRDAALAPLLKALKAANTGARAGGLWNDRIRHDIKAVGVLVDTHVRFSLNGGWHPHLHLTVPCLTNDEDAILAGAEMLVQRYLALLTAAGYGADIDQQHVAILDIDGDERGYAYPAFHHRPAPVKGDLPEAKDEDTSLSPFDIALLAVNGDKDMEARFVEFASAMRGTRSAIVTAPMARALAIESDSDDRAILDESTRVGTLPSRVWSELLNENLQSTFLSCVSTFGRQNWNYVWWWAHLNTGLAPPVLEEAAEELMLLFAAMLRLDDDGARSFTLDMIQERISTLTDQFGPALAASTLDYAEAHYRYTKLDGRAVAKTADSIENWMGKRAIRLGREQASYVTLATHHDGPCETVPIG